MLELFKKFAFNFSISYLGHMLITAISIIIGSLFGMLLFFIVPPLAVILYFLLGTRLKPLGNHVANYLSVTGNLVFAITVTIFALKFPLEFPPFVLEVLAVNPFAFMMMIPPMQSQGNFALSFGAMVPSLVMWIGLTYRKWRNEGEKNSNDGVFKIAIRKIVAVFSIAVLVAIFVTAGVFVAQAVEQFNANKVSDDERIGSIIEFGDKKWRVLNVSDGKMLIISEYILERRAYTPAGRGENVWHNSAIRMYLNNRFLNSFTEEERSRIVATRVLNNCRLTYSVRNDRTTTDYVFLLSINELVRYFGDSGLLAERFSNFNLSQFNRLSDQYNDNRIAFDVSNGEAHYWWLRTGISRNIDVGVVDSEGRVSAAQVGILNIGVRPAMWIMINE